MQVANLSKMVPESAEVCNTYIPYAYHAYDGYNTPIMVGDSGKSDDVGNWS